MNLLHSSAGLACAALSLLACGGAPAQPVGSAPAAAPLVGDAFFVARGASLGLSPEAARARDAGISPTSSATSSTAILASGKHARVATRFPPEPNGYLHIGHAKSICLNFGIAEDYRRDVQPAHGRHEPETEGDQEYVDAIKNDVRWLGFEWGEALFASDYFEFRCTSWPSSSSSTARPTSTPDAEAIASTAARLRRAGHGQPVPRPHRRREPRPLSRMRAGEFADGAHVLRAKIDMASPNMKMRDPLLYRIRTRPTTARATTGASTRCTTTRTALEDSLEGITHSICTLEFENNRDSTTGSGATRAWPAARSRSSSRASTSSTR
jgi:glutaminyl-tRNA synthetase